MIKHLRLHQVKGYLVGLCFFLALSASETPYSKATEKLSPSIESSLEKAEFWLSQMAQTIGLSSLAFEIHGASLQISEIVAHLGQILPPAFDNWKPTGQVTFDLAMTEEAGQESKSQTLSLKLQLRNVKFSSPDATRRGSGLEGRVSARLGLPDSSDQPTSFHAEVELEGGEIVLDGFRFNLKENPFRLRLLGGYDNESRRLSPLSVFFSIPSIGRGTITGVLEASDDLRGEMKATLGPIANDRAFNLLVKQLLGRGSSVLQGLSMSGETLMSAVVRGSLRNYTIQGVIETSSPKLEISAYQIKAEGVKIRLPFSVVKPDSETTPSPIRSNTSGDGQIHIDRIRWESGELQNISTSIAFVQDTLVIGRIELPARRGAVILEGTKIQKPFSPLVNVSIGVFLKDVHLEERSLGSLLLPRLINWRLSGAMDLRLAMGGRNMEAPEQAFDVRLSNVSFSSPDQTKLGESINGRVQARLRFPDSKDRHVSFLSDFNFDAGEILLGAFYLNLQVDPIRFQPQGTYDLQSRRFSTFTIHFHAPTWGEGTLTAALQTREDPRGEVKFTVGPISNERAFALFVKEPFAHISPIVEGLAINGETFITGEIRGSPNDYSIEGLIETSALDLMIPARRLEAKKVRIRFPFSLKQPGGEGITSRGGSNQSRDGFIKGDWIRWRSQEWRNINVSMILKDDTYFFPNPMKLPILGGALVFEEARIENPFGRKRKITMGLRLERLDFSSVTELFLPFAIPGHVEGDFSEIRASENTLETRGNLSVYTLGGQIKVEEIHGNSPFSRLRKISMNVLFENINLEEASQSFEFGKMGGIIEGEMKGFSFSFGQPESFELEIRSVKKRGIKQYVNAEAVNNLSILSTGSGFSFRKGAVQFLKYYPYAKLGIYCKLQNDVFTLRGTIHRKGVEYLIKRGPIGGIDVINQNPENRIRWRQMLRRLKAIGQDMGKVEVSTQK